MKNFTLPPCWEDPEVYNFNKKRNQAIFENFKASNNEENVKRVSSIKVEVNYVPSQMRLRNEETSVIPYAESNLGTDGCAVFCMHDALNYARGLGVSLESVAKEMGDKGYLDPGNGTFHCAFDHAGCQRAKDVREIFQALATRERAIVTALVQNCVYHQQPNRGGRHFVNLIFFKLPYFLVNDDMKGRGVKVPINLILNATDVAWIW